VKIAQYILNIEGQMKSTSLSEQIANQGLGAASAISRWISPTCSWVL
jgi:hypothetical protein